MSELQYSVSELKSTGDGFVVRRVTPYEGGLLPDTVRVEITIEATRQDTHFFTTKDKLPLDLLDENLPAFCWFSRDGHWNCRWATKGKFPTQ